MTQKSGAALRAESLFWVLIQVAADINREAQQLALQSNASCWASLFVVGERAKRCNMWIRGC